MGNKLTAHAYQSREEFVTRGVTVPAEFAVKDTSGWVRARFETEAAAEAYAARVNAQTPEVA
jgi:hypothetical protein